MWKKTYLSVVIIDLAQKVLSNSSAIVCLFVIRIIWSLLVDLHQFLALDIRLLGKKNISENFGPVKASEFFPGTQKAPTLKHMESKAV